MELEKSIGNEKKLYVTYGRKEKKEKLLDKVGLDAEKDTNFCVIGCIYITLKNGKIDSDEEKRILDFYQLVFNNSKNVDRIKLYYLQDLNYTLGGNKLKLLKIYGEFGRSSTALTENKQESSRKH